MKNDALGILSSLAPSFGALYRRSGVKLHCFAAARLEKPRSNASVGPFTRCRSSISFFLY